jgi:hypothetical protein
MSKGVEHFSCIYWPFVFLHLRSYSSYVHLLIILVTLVFNFFSSLYILDFNPLSDDYLANIFSHSVGCFFTLLVGSFDIQKLFNLM